MTVSGTRSGAHLTVQNAQGLVDGHSSVVGPVVATVLVAARDVAMAVVRGVGGAAEDATRSAGQPAVHPTRPGSVASMKGAVDDAAQRHLADVSCTPPVTLQSMGVDDKDLRRARREGGR